MAGVGFIKPGVGLPRSRAPAMALNKSLGTNPQFVSVDLAHGDARFRNDTTGAPTYQPTRVPAGHAAQGGAVRLLARHRAQPRDRTGVPKST